MRIQPFRSVVSCLALASAGFAQTIVDDDGGPGVDFTEIADAVNAAVDGELILVRAGAYAGFVVPDVELTILAERCSVAVGSPILVVGLSNGRDVVMTGLSAGDVTVDACQGSVLFAGCIVEGVVSATNSIDVRFHDSRIDPTAAAVFAGRASVVSDAARVEFVGCRIIGERGFDEVGIGGPGAGGPGVEARGGSRVHAALSTVQGGFGGNGSICTGADGGEGIHVLEMSTIIASGRPTDAIVGGASGDSNVGVPGIGGNGIEVDDASLLRHSGVSFGGGMAPGIGYTDGVPLDLDSGVVELAEPADPRLAILDPAAFTFRIEADPGALVHLAVGVEPTVQNPDGLFLEQLVVPLREFPLGALPASGFIDHPVPELGAFPVGTVFIAQATAFVVGTGRARSNSVVLALEDVPFGPDCNLNCISDADEPDCNGNGVPDDCDLQNGVNLDCNGNGVLDECDIALGVEPDCNANGVPDACELAGAQSLDCNGNGVPDDCDIAIGLEEDCNANGVPDACEVSWYETQKIDPTGLPGGMAGEEVALSGTTAVVGYGAFLPFQSYFTEPFVTVLRFVGGAWQLETRLTAAGTSVFDGYGRAVAIDGRTVAVGALSSSRTYVFERDVTGTFVETAELVPPDSFGPSFGSAVAVEGARVFVAAVHDGDLGALSGSAYVFERVADVWSFDQKLLPSDGMASTEFGRSVDASGSVLAVGADDPALGSFTGAVYVFRAVGGLYVEEAKLTPNDGAEGFGRALAIDGDVVVVGAPFDDEDGSNAGSAYVFRRVQGQWVEDQKLGSPQPANGGFGTSVALDGTRVVAGEPWFNGVGAAHVFEGAVGGPLTFVDTLTRSEPGFADFFGEAVAIGPVGLLVGASLDDLVDDDSGAVHTFAFEPDCNQNGAPDACDIASGVSADLNGNGIPDECPGG